MGKKDKAIYAPGELSRIRDKLGVSDAEEARELAQKLGGDVGYERTENDEKIMHGRTRRERVDVKIGDRPGRPRRTVELPLDFDDEDFTKKKPYRPKGLDPGDDPLIPLKVNYWERIKMDKFAGQSEFDIKSPAQVFQSIVSLFSDIPDYVSQTFVLKRMGEYYKKIELMVLSTRNMFPRNNMRRNERMKRSSPIAFSILDIIRNWDIEKISGDLVRIQSRPKSARVGDFADILRAIYKPLFVLEQLDLDTHIRGAYKILYKLLYIESPSDAQKKYQELIRIALTAFSGTRRDIHYLLYPLLMKSVSAKFLPYEVFFAERKNRIMAFLNVIEENQITPIDLNMQIDAKDIKETEQKETAPPSQDTQPGEEAAEVLEEEVSEEEKVRRVTEEGEKKALERGLQALESLFPQAGWDKLPSYPDLYPYFVEIFDLKKGKINIAPTDPMQQILILMRILQELFFGLRYVSFGSIHGLSGNTERIDGILGEIINNWNYYIEQSYEKEYLPRLTDYIRIMEGSPEERTSMYTKKLITELHWLKRLYFLPYYKFESLVPPPFQKGEINPIYVKIKTLRRYLGAVAAGIEQGTKAGGAEARAPCDGIDNPWDPYVFQVPNPLSIRLDALLGPKIKNNASLVYFSLAVTTVLNHLLNNEDSWAYSSPGGPLFRSEKGEGVTPLSAVEERIDADALFKQVLKQRQKKA